MTVRERSRLSPTITSDRAHSTPLEDLVGMLAAKQGALHDCTGCVLAVRYRTEWQFPRCRSIVTPLGSSAGAQSGRPEHSSSQAYYMGRCTPPLPGRLHRWSPNTMAIRAWEGSHSSSWRAIVTRARSDAVISACRIHQLDKLPDAGYHLSWFPTSLPRQRLMHVLSSRMLGRLFAAQENGRPDWRKEGTRASHDNQLHRFREPFSSLRSGAVVVESLAGLSSER